MTVARLPDVFSQTRAKEIETNKWAVYRRQLITVVQLTSTPYSFFIEFISALPELTPPQWGAAEAEIDAPSVENTELKGPSFKAWSRVLYSHTGNAYMA